MASTKTARQTKAELTRATIVEKGIALIEERGYDNVSVQDIVGAAQVSVGTFYHYFESKDAFYYSYIHSMFTDVDGSLLEHMDLPLIYNLRHYFEMWFKQIQQLSPEYLAQWLGHSADSAYHERVNLVQDVGQMHIDAIQACLEGYVAKGELAPGAPTSELAVRIVTVLYGVDVRWCMTNGKLDLGQWSTFLTELVRVTLGPSLQEEGV